MTNSQPLSDRRRATAGRLRRSAAGGRSSAVAIPLPSTKRMSFPLRWPAAADAWLLLVWLALACGLVGLFASASIPHLAARFVDDDAAYYLEIARHVAVGDGSTFDGLHRTNGFHPLWLLCLIPVQWLAGGVPDVAFRLSLGLCVALGWGALFLLARLGRSCRVPPLATAAGLAVLGEGLLVSGSYGMEMFLLVALVALTLWFATGCRALEGEAAARQEWLLGGFLGLAILARLDSIFLLAGLLLSGAVCRRSVLRLLGAASLVVLPYLAWNRLTFGHVMPISGALKSSFPHVTLANLPCLRHLAVPCLAVLYLCAGCARAPGARRRPCAPVARWLATATLLHFAYSMLFMRWGVKDWHFALYPLAAAVMLMDVLAALAVFRSSRGRVHLNTRPRAPGAVVLLLCLILAGLMARKLMRPQDDFNAAVFETARWAQRHLPADAVFVMKDAGFFGFFSGRCTVNADGLVNDYAFQEQLRRGELAGYLRKNRAQYLVQQVPRERADVLSGDYDRWDWRDFSQLYGVYSDPVVLRRACEVYRSRLYRSGSIRSRFVIWKLAGSP